MSIRITADIDSKNKLKLFFYLNNIFKYIEKIERITIKPSNSKGYHFIVFTKKRYSKKEVYKIRKLIGDDENRIKNDKKRKIGEQTLFDKKIYSKNYLYR